MQDLRHSCDGGTVAPVASEAPISGNQQRALNTKTGRAMATKSIARYAAFF